MVQAAADVEFFRERIPFRKQPVVAVVLVVIVIGLALTAFSGDAANEPVTFVVSLVLPAAVLVLFLTLEQDTVVETNGLSVRFRPFPPRRVAWSDVATVEVVTNRPLLQWGGWGYRRRLRGTAFIVRGTRGVQFTYNDGKTLLVGSDDPDGLEQGVRAAMRR